MSGLESGRFATPSQVNAFNCCLTIAQTTNSYLTIAGREKALLTM